MFPGLAVVADAVPARTETGIGALMPWADRLWFVTYVAHKAGTGSGTGLFSVDAEMRLTKHPASVVGTYANRMIHRETNQLIIGPHLIDTEGGVRTFDALVNVRLTAVARHLEEPARKVYFLGMEGEFFEADVETLEVRRLFDLRRELDFRPKAYLHFKDAFTGHGRVVVANNAYEGRDYDGPGADGRLAEWDGQGWKVLERCQFNAVTGRTSIGNAIFAAGADNASAILEVYLPATGWQTYRLPKGTHTQDNTVTTEWPRIREVESERWLMNASGMFYELPAMQYANRVWGVRPVCTHLRIIGDFCSWRGLLVLAGDQTTPIGDSNPFVGQPQANLWFGKTDDLWRLGGKPAGWGGVWRRTEVAAESVSDPFLMTGFEHKCLHLSQHGAPTAAFRLEVDFLGDGDWHPYGTFALPDGGYLHHEFPAGFSAHWVRLHCDAACTATAHFVYT
ncbi:MAG: hypothetical protein JXR77_05045 [Lentisphaeria bacterium]|nr:hypothetical protein [Lentisphaeria bacterium]